MYRKLIKASQTIWRVMVITYERFGDMRATESAAGMSYYALFSLFPLLLFLIVAGSFVLEDQAAYQTVIDLVLTLVPVSSQVVVDNLQEVLDLRGTMGLVAGVGLLWSASGFFGILSHQVNIIRPKAKPRTGWHMRLIGLAIVAGLAVLLILWMFLSPILRVVLDLLTPILAEWIILARGVITLVTYWLLPFTLAYLLYRYVPRGKARSHEALVAAIIVMLAWNVATLAFTWYLASGLVQYRLVYGSLGSLIALIFWIYITNLIILVGAHISAAIAQHAQESSDNSI